MAIVGWLWRRHGGNALLKAATPRRLVYCLPMRILVEQTRAEAKRWVEALRATHLGGADVPVHVLMGGEERDDWDVHPERDAIIIGTQDMLISRALNRGYGASRARWPMHFGLLNTDCLWVFDEIQLMGSGLATTSQLDAFRRSLGAGDGNGCRSVWMSATMRPEWLATVDFKEHLSALKLLTLKEADHGNKVINARWQAAKPVTRADATMDDQRSLADEICRTHRPGTRTIVVVNTVKRACELHKMIAARSSGSPTGRPKGKGPTKSASIGSDIAPKDSASPPKIVLLHSRFRPDDRARAVAAVLEPPSAQGTIVVSTQVIEAGVDVSATTLFTELAPWASLVQRFGRCNRRGDENEHASVRWVDLPEDGAEKVSPPYECADLRRAAEQLKAMTDVGLGSLDALKIELPFNHTHVIRRKDLIDLFDTTPDMAGNDIDIDRYVREIDETDVRVFWRSWTDDRPTDVEPQPERDELCPAPIGEFKDFVKEERVRGRVFRRDFLEGKWMTLEAGRIAPGQVYMVHVDAGGYDPDRGWDPKASVRVVDTPSSDERDENSSDYDCDELSVTSVWQTIAQHTDAVCRELDDILNVLNMGDHETNDLRVAARWHDWGKAHSVFQEAIGVDGRPAEWVGSRVVAKAPQSRHGQPATVGNSGFWSRYTRKHFRHELASALGVLQRTVPLPDADRDLVAYLIAAHHGKVRLSIRSFPDERRPATGLRFARGVWDHDALPAVDLGGRVSAPTVTLSLEPMELGLCESPPFAGDDGVGEPSWIERVLRLRDRLGPFRLAHLESVLRAADERASKAACCVRNADGSRGSEDDSVAVSLEESNR